MQEELTVRAALDLPVRPCETKEKEVVPGLQRNGIVLQFTARETRVDSAQRRKTRNQERQLSFRGRQFQCSCETPDRAFFFPPWRLAHRRLAQFVLQHDPLAVHVKSAEPPGRAAPARPIGRDKLNLAADFRRVKQSEPRRIELQEIAGPAGAQVEVGCVETNAAFITLAN